MLPVSKSLPLFAPPLAVAVALAVALALALGGCGASSSTTTPATTASGATAKSPDRVVGRAGSRASSRASEWLPLSRHGEEGTIDGVPLIAVAGTDVLIDGIAIADLGPVVAASKTTRIEGLFSALRSRRDAWLTTHATTAWPGVVAFRFERETSAAVVKSVILTAGYAACPSGSLLVETRGDEKKRVGRLAVDPLMIAAPYEKILSVEVRKDAFAVAWRDGKPGRAKEIPRSDAEEVDPVELRELAAEISAVWEAAGIHRAPADTRVDQAILHVDDAVPYRVLAAVIDAIYAPRRTMLIAGREERVPALNVNLAAD